MTVSEPIRRLPMAGFLGGTGISLLGNAMAMLAIPWFVLETTGSASQTGFAGVAGALPMALSGIIGGPIVDRFGGRAISIVSDVVSAVAIALIPLLYQLDMLTYPIILVLVFLGAMLDIPGVTARRLLLPGFQKQAQIRAEQMNSFFEVLTNVAMLIGPVLAGVLIVWMGPVNLLWLTTAGFLISAAGVLFLAPTHEVAESNTRKQPYMESVREGFAFIVQTRVLLALAILFGATNAISNGFSGVALPVFVFETWGTATRLGVLFTSLGIGQIIGALRYGSSGHGLIHRRRMIVLIGFMLQPIWMVTFLWSESLPLLMASMFMSGFSAGPINPLSVTVRFEHIPKALQGRVFATFSAITATVTPIGLALSGVMIDKLGIQTGLLILLLAYTVLALSLPFVRPLKDLNTPGPYA